MKTGTKVKMVNCAEARKHLDKIWTTCLEHLQRLIRCKASSFLGLRRADIVRCLKLTAEHGG